MVERAYELENKEQRKITGVNLSSGCKIWPQCNLNFVGELSRSGIISVRNSALGTKGEVLFVVLVKSKILNRGSKEAVYMRDPSVRGSCDRP